MIGEVVRNHLDLVKMAARSQMLTVHMLQNGRISSLVSCIFVSASLSHPTR